MKNLLLVLLISVSLGVTAQDTAIKEYSNAPKAFKKGIDKALVSYLEIKDALVKENSIEAKKAALSLKVVFDKTPTTKLTTEQSKYYSSNSTYIQKQCMAIQNDSVDIEQVRTVFETISQSVYALVKSFQANQTEIYLQYCPMAANNNGAFWLSDREIVLNPYFGNRMLHCGSVEEVIE